MTKLKTTPGPWYCGVGVGAIEVRGEAIDGVPSPRVCRVLRVDPRSESNARLICEAPAMLDALLDAHATIQGLAMSGTGDDEGAMTAQATEIATLIARAVGAA